MALISKFVIAALFGCVLGPDDSTDIVTIHFRSGNQLSGEIISEASEEGRKYLVFRTESGSVLKLDKAKLVQRVVPIGPEQQEYRKLVEAMQQTPDEHWRMYQWCKSDGRRSRFKKEIQFHLRKIVELDPSDAKAWQLLDYIQVDGQWIPEEQHYSSTGYVKTRGKWVPEIQVEVDRQKDSREQFFNARKTALAKWKRNILPDEGADVVRDELYKLVDPVSVVFFAGNYLKKEKNPELRALYIEAIGQVESSAAQQVLVNTVMNDPDADVAEQAMLMLEQKHYDPDVSTRLLSIFLDNEKTRVSNRVVNKAARKLGRLNRNAAIIPLIGALRTTHTVATGNDPGRITTGFDSTGGASLSTGGPKTVRKTFENEDVMFALEQISGESFGYDEQAWKEWFVSQHTTMAFDLRRDWQD